MKNKSLLRRLVLTLLLSVGVCGCAAPIIIAMGAGAVGGYAASRDSFEGTTTKGQEELWSAASEVAAIMGAIEESNRKSSVMIARVNGATVTITIIPINLTTCKLRIKARKGIFPRIGVAQEVYSKIMNQLE